MKARDVLALWSSSVLPKASLIAGLLLMDHIGQLLKDVGIETVKWGTLIEGKIWPASKFM